MPDVELVTVSFRLIFFSVDCGLAWRELFESRMYVCAKRDNTYLYLWFSPRITESNRQAWDCRSKMGLYYCCALYAGYKSDTSGTVIVVARKCNCCTFKIKLRRVLLLCRIEWMVFDFWVNEINWKLHKYENSNCNSNNI